METTSTVKSLTSTGRSAVQTELVIPTRVYSKTKVCAGVKKGDGNQFSWHLPNILVVQQPRCPPPSVPVKVPEQKLRELTAKIMNSQMSRERGRCVKLLDAPPQKGKENIKVAKKVVKKANQQPRLMLKSTKMFSSLRSTFK